MSFLSVRSTSLFLFALTAGATAPAAHGKNKKGAPVASEQPAAGVQGSPVTSEVWDFQVKSEDSFFSIVTQKKGFAAALAHNHLIAARAYQADLKANPQELEKGTFSFSTKASELEVDRADLQKRWFPTIKSLGWLTEPFSELKDSDRETIREHMLDSNQLNGKKFPEITAKVIDIKSSETKLGEKNFSKSATVAVTLLNKTVSRPFATNLTLKGDELTVEAAGQFKFSDFGITPYSALLGAVGNQDQFFMLVNIRAVKK